MTELVTKEEKIATTQESNIEKMIKFALTNNVDITALERLFALKQEEDSKTAKKSYFVDFSNFQYNCPDIKKTKSVSFGSNKNAIAYKYAPLGDIAKQIKSPLNDNNLCYRFEKKAHEDGSLTVTCIVSHIDGHSEKTTMTSYPDNSGSKNLIQQNASATTYLMRYTLIMALGLTTADEDIDARMPETFEYITDDELANLEDLVGSYVTNRSKLMEFLGVKELSHLKRSQYQNAVQAIKMKGSKK